MFAIVLKARPNIMEENDITKRDYFGLLICSSHEFLKFEGPYFLDWYTEDLRSIYFTNVLRESLAMLKEGSSVPSILTCMLFESDESTLSDALKIS